MELRSEKQREYKTDQCAGKAALGQPARIGPKAELRKAQRSAQPWGGGSLVPPRQARERRTGLYTRLRLPSQAPINCKQYIA